MGTVRGPNVIGVCLSPLQGEGSVWCLLDTGEDVRRLAAPRRSRWKSQKLEWIKRQIGEKERKEEDFAFPRG